MSESEFWCLLTEGAIMGARASVRLVQGGTADREAWMNVRRALLHMSAAIDRRYGRGAGVDAAMEGE